MERRTSGRPIGTFPTSSSGRLKTLARLTQRQQLGTLLPEALIYILLVRPSEMMSQHA